MSASLSILDRTRVIQRAHHVLHNFLAVRFAGAFLSYSASPVHHHDAIRDRKDVRKRVADEDDRHLLFTQSTYHTRTALW